MSPSFFAQWPALGLGNDVVTAGQIQAADLQLLAQEGFSVVVCHRPDDEEPGQPAATDLASAAEAAGLIFVHAPVRGMPDRAAVEATGAALDALPPGRRALLFCRSGLRSTVAWALAARARGTDAERLREAAAGAGYDLSRVPL
jgi:uncharacterized protein (TIGR01244 family)